MAHITSPLSQADRFSPAALAFAVLLHVAMAAGLWWLAPFRPFKPVEDVIEVTVDRGGSPPAEQAAAEPEPPQQSPPQTLSMPRPPPPSPPTERPKPEPPRAEQPQPEQPPPEPPQPAVEQAVPPPEPPPPPPTAMDFPKPAPPPPPKEQPKPQTQPQPQRPPPAAAPRPPATEQAARPAPSPLRHPNDVIVGPAVPTQNEYFQQLHRKLAQHRYYPQTARDRHQEGRVVVRLVIARDGRLLDTRVERSSGVPAIDQAEIDAVRRAAPFPPLPIHVAGDAATFLIPVTYELR